MLIKREKAEKKENSKTCTVWEYNFQSKKLDFATARIDGRYPEQGKVINIESDMIYFVLSGEGIIHHKSGDFNIKEHDAFFFKKGEWYWIEGDNLFVAVCDSPAWFPKQYKKIE